MIPNLKRPLVFFDMESTGPDKNNDRIIQFCFLRYEVDGSTNILTSKVNPMMAISQAATNVHGITNDMLAGFPEFHTHAANIMACIEGADLVGYGVLMFDVPLLFNELLRAGILWDYHQHNIIDACNIYKRNVPRDLSAAFSFYVGGKFENTHDAYADTVATADVFFSQLSKHDLKEKEMSHLALYSNYDKLMVDLNGKFTVNDAGDIIFNFGPKKGEKAKDHPDFIQWMLSKEFPMDVQIVCERILDELYPERKTQTDLPF